MAEREFRIIVPRIDNSGNWIAPDLFVGVAKAITDEANGVTINPRTAGCFVGDHGQVECDLSVEFSTTVTGSDADVHAAERFFHDYAEILATQLGQESLFEQVVFDTRTEFRPGQRRPHADQDPLGPGQPIARTPEAILSRALQTRQAE